MNYCKWYYTKITMSFYCYLLYFLLFLSMNNYEAIFEYIRDANLNFRLLKSQTAGRCSSSFRE